MTRRGRILLKSGVWAAALTPLALLAYWIYADELGPNPIDDVTRWLGIWTLRLLLTTLTMTPLRLVFGLAWPITLRRLFGLFAFAYATIHFSVWIVVDHFFDWPTMADDLVKRPFMTAGMGALLMLIPLAVTSTAGMVKRLGGAAWRRLHRLAYLAGVLAVLHFLWLAKVGRQTPYYYAGWLLLVLGVRVWDPGLRAARKRRRAVATAPLAAELLERRRG